MTGDAIKVNELPDQFRRKAEFRFGALEDRVTKLESLPAYGGVWRLFTPTPVTLPLTTSWQVLTGFTEDRPDIPKRMTVDYPTGLVTVEETGVYDFKFVIVVDGPLNRYIELGARTDGVDPANAVVRNEFISANGQLIVSYSNMFSITTAPVDYQVVIRGEIAMNVDFYGGGWSLGRRDFNNPAMVNQKAMP